MRFFILSTALCLATPALADVPRPDTVSDTLELLLDAVRGAGFPNAVIDLEQQAVVSDSNSEDSTVTYPDNLHRNLRNAADDAERQQILDDFVAVLTVTSADDSDGFAPEQVMPVLRPLDYLDDLGDDAEIETRPFAGDLMIAYVADFPTHTTSISPDSMAAAGYNAESLHQLALQNLQTRSADLSIEGSEVGVYFLTLDGYYENAMMLNAGLWDSVTDQIGPVVVSVPARDLVLIATADNAEAIEIMRDIRDDVLRDGAYTLTGVLFSWGDGRWSVVPD